MFGLGPVEAQQSCGADYAATKNRFPQSTSQRETDVNLFLSSHVYFQLCQETSKKNNKHRGITMRQAERETGTQKGNTQRYRDGDRDRNKKSP